MFERMAEAEEEQKERPLGPCPERRRACRCDQHQGIDLEPFDPKAVDRFAQRVVAAEEITQQVECQPSPTEIRAQLLETETGCKQRSGNRSEEHTSELQSLMRISYAVFCLKKTKKHKQITQ